MGEVATVTWAHRVRALGDKLGRPPTLEELLEEAKDYEMSEDEIAEQAKSFARGMMQTGDPRFD